MSAEMSLRDLDALELGELLAFLADFLAAEAHTVAPALDRFCANGFTLVELCADLARFAFLLGGDGTGFVLADQQ